MISLLRHLRQLFGMELSELADFVEISMERASMIDRDPTHADPEEREKIICALTEELYIHFDDDFECTPEDAAEDEMPAERPRVGGSTVDQGETGPT